MPCTTGSDFDVPIGANGDTFDRYLVRIKEMRESLKIVRQCIEQIPEGPVKSDTPFFVRPPVGDAYAAVEAPKGELGFYIVSDGGISPYRCKIRSPSYINLKRPSGHAHRLQDGRPDHHLR